jgi:hypothetical protein
MTSHTHPISTALAAVLSSFNDLHIETTNERVAKVLGRLGYVVTEEEVARMREER